MIHAKLLGRLEYFAMAMKNLGANENEIIDEFLKVTSRGEAMEMIGWCKTFDNALPMSFWNSRPDWRGFIMVYDDKKARFGKLFNFNRYFSWCLRNAMKKVHLGT